MLESEDNKLVEKINESKEIVDMVRAISEKEATSDNERETGSFEGEDPEDDGEGEVVGLAKRCLEFLGGGGSTKVLTEG